MNFDLRARASAQRRMNPARALLFFERRTYGIESGGIGQDAAFGGGQKIRQRGRLETIPRKPSQSIEQTTRSTQIDARH
jgi:hypothetical protein